MRKRFVKFSPFLLIAFAATALVLAIGVFRNTLQYPSITINAPENVDITFLFNGRRDRASCERLTAGVGNSILAVCPACRIQEKKCLATLSEPQRRLLSTEPLDVPSARLPDGGVVIYRAASLGLALAACRESEKQAATRPESSRVVCHAPMTERPLISQRGNLFGDSSRPLGLMLLVLAGIAFGFAFYLINRREDLQAYLSSLPRTAKRMIMLGLDIVLFPAALSTALFVQYGMQWVETDGLELMLVLAPLAAIPVFVKMGMYRAVIRYLEFRMALTVVASVTIAVLLFVGVLYLLAIRNFEADDAVVYWLLALLYVGASRVIARAYLRQSSDTGTAPDRVIIYGAGDAGAHLAISLKGNVGLMPVAFVDDSPDLVGSQVYGIKVHPTEQLPSLVRKLEARQILLAIPSASKKRRKEIFDRIEDLGARIRTIPRLSALIEGRAKINEIEDFSVEDLVGRDPVPPIPGLLVKCIERKTVLVTGAGGSIGSELCRRILSLSPKKLVLVEMSEYALYSIQEELLNRKRQYAFSTEIVSVLASTNRKGLLTRILNQHQVNTIFHAAAYKHVPLVEANPLEAILNNVIGSLRAAEAAISEQVETFVLVSTDKAVRPTSIMGATKRLAELIVQAIGANARTRFCMVRFGNVLESSGSVVPLFRKQIQEGGPVTVTHPDVTHYFMTIPEAAQLVIQAGAMAKGGDVFVLDMGGPVRILDLAIRMIRLSGRAIRDEDHPDGDIEIRFTGLRPGEKLYEELLIENNVLATDHPLIMRAMEEVIPWTRLKPLLDAIEEACNQLDGAKALSLLLSVVPLTSNAEAAEPGPDAQHRRTSPLKLVT